MLFRPEEVHAASSQAPGYFSRQNPGERDIHMSYGRRRVDLQDFIVSHADENRLPAIKTPCIDSHLFSGEEPAHGQRFEPSLAVPLLLTFYCYKIMGRHIGKR